MQVAHLLLQEKKRSLIANMSRSLSLQGRGQRPLLSADRIAAMCTGSDRIVTSTFSFVITSTGSNQWGFFLVTAPALRKLSNIHLGKLKKKKSNLGTEWKSVILKQICDLSLCPPRVSLSTSDVILDALLCVWKSSP